METELKIIYKLDESRWEDFKNLKIEAVTNEPLAFSPGVEAYRDWDEAKWKESLTSQEFQIVFAEVDGKLVGMGSIYYFQMSQFAHNASLQSLYVRNEWRNKGIGTKLIEERIKIISENPQFKNILTEVFSSQQASIDLHKKLGFEVVGVIKNFLHYNGNYYDSYKLEKFLS